MTRNKTSGVSGMNLLGRFSLLQGTALLLFGLLLGRMITSHSERMELAREKEYLARYVREEVKHRDLSPDDFAVPKTGPAHESFRRRLEEVRHFGDVFQVTLFSPEGTVVWSDSRAAVGGRSSSPALQKALRGEVEAEWTTPGREGLPPAGSPKEILDLYVPIPGKAPDGVIGVVGIRQSADDLRESVRKEVAGLWIALAGGFSIIYLVLFGIVRQGHRMLLSSQEELRASREKIREQNMELLRQVGLSVRGEREIGKVLASVTEEVRRLLDLPRCSIRIFGDPDTVVEDRAPGIPSGGSALPGSTLSGCSVGILPGGETLVVDDIRETPEYRDRKEEIDRPGPGSYLGVPLRTQEGMVGVLFLERAEPHRWTRVEVSTAEEIAGQMAMAVRQARLSREQEELTGRLVALMNNVPGVVYRGYPDWSIGFMGGGAEQITGYLPNEFSSGSLNWRERILPEDREMMESSMREAIRRGDRNLRLEYRAYRKDGSVGWFADRRQLVYGSDGRFVYVDGLALDITEQKRSEETLRLIQFTVDRAGDAAYWMDSEGRLLYVNETTCDTLGYTREELLAMTIREITPGFPGDSWREHWEMIRTRKSFLMETWHRAKDGRLLPVEVTVNYLEFDGREYNCAFARDITERLRSREESERLQEQLLQSQKMEALGNLAGGVAHDFNNLLTGILGYADLLEREAAPASRTAEAARVIRESAERASRLTAQLLGFARKGKNLAVPVDLRKTAGDVVKILERTLDRRIRIVTRFPDALPIVLGDPTQLSQVAMNLGVNARDAMPGGGELTISIERRELGPEFCRENPGAAPGRYVVLSCRDTGVGIPEELLPRIFEPFFSTKEPGKGSGLGLSMVFGIVKNHGGYISVRSAVGQGTTVTAYLPSHEGSSAAEDSRGSPADSLPGGKGVVLLVDDEETVRDVCSSMLDLLGYEVIPATTGEEGVERYRERWKEIDLVILDNIMPKMGGRDCFRRIREINPRARVLLATGYSLDGAVQEILNEGMEGFLQKPFRLDQLAGAVSRALRRAG